MDKTFLRHQALNIAQSQAKPGATAEKLLKDADKVLSWLSKDWVEPAAETGDVPAGAVHESEDAVGKRDAA